MSTNQVSIRVRLTALRDFIMDSKRVQAELARMERAAKMQSRAQMQAANRTTTAWTKMRRASWAMRTSFLGLGVSAGFAVTTLARSALDFESEMKRVAVITNRNGVVSEASYKRMTEAAIESARLTKFSNVEAAEGLYQLAAAGFTADQATKSLYGTLNLAAATGVDVSKAAEVQAALLNQFQLSKDDQASATRVADVMTRAINASALEMEHLRVSMKYIGPVASSLGQSLEDTTTALAVMAQNGIKGSQAGTGLRMGLIRMIKPIGQAKDALKDMNLTTADLTGPKGLKPFPKLLELIRERTADMSKAERNATIVRLVGVHASTQWIGLLNAGAGAWRNMSKEINNSNVTAKITGEEMNKTVKGAFERFWDNLEALAARGLMATSEGIQSFTNSASEGIASLADPTSRARKWLQPFVDTFVQLFRIVWSFAKDALVVVAAGWIMLRAVLVILQPILEFIADNFDYFKILIFGIIAGLAAYNIITGVMALKTKLAAKSVAIFNWVLLANPLVLMAVLIIAVVAALVYMYFKFAWFRNLIQNIFGWIRDNWKWLAIILTGPIGLAIVLIVENFDKLKGAAMGLWSVMKTAFWKVVNAIKGPASTIANIVGGIIKGVYGAIRFAWNAVSDIWEPIKDRINDVWPGPNFPSIPKLPELAAGGSIISGGAALVGERGPEIVHLPTGSSVSPIASPNIAPISPAVVGAGSPGEIRIPLYLDGRVVAESVFNYAQHRKARR